MLLTGQHFVRYPRIMGLMVFAVMLLLSVSVINNRPETSRRLSNTPGKSKCKKKSNLRIDSLSNLREMLKMRTLYASYPGSGMSSIVEQSEGLTGLKVGDEYDTYIDLFSKGGGIIKTQYPHYKGAWSYGDTMDQVVMMVRNPRWAIPTYYHNQSPESWFSSNLGDEENVDKAVKNRDSSKTVRNNEEKEDTPVSLDDYLEESIKRQEGKSKGEKPAPAVGGIFHSTESLEKIAERIHHASNPKISEPLVDGLIHSTEPVEKVARRFLKARDEYHEHSLKKQEENETEKINILVSGVVNSYESLEKLAKTIHTTSDIKSSKPLIGDGAINSKQPVEKIAERVQDAQRAAGLGKRSNLRHTRRLTAMDDESEKDVIPSAAKREEKEETSDTTLVDDDLEENINNAISLYEDALVNAFNSAITEREEKIRKAEQKWNDWKKSNFEKELSLWALQIDFYMEDGSADYWMNDDVKSSWMKRYGQDGPFHQNSNTDNKKEGSEEKERDVHCKKDVSGSCFPVAVITHERLNNPATGPSELIKLANALFRDDSSDGEKCEDDDESESVINPNTISYIYHKTWLDNHELNPNMNTSEEPSAQELADKNKLTFDELDQVLDKLTEMRHKYSSGPKWVNEPLAWDLVSAFDIYIDQILSEMSAMCSHNNCGKVIEEHIHQK